MSKRPRWFTLSEQLAWPLIDMGLAAANSTQLSTPDLRILPYDALCHHAACLKTGWLANLDGKHSAAICLVRQSVEALTVAEIGLQNPNFAGPLLVAWKEGRKSQGELRRELEKHVWPRYGNGLWDETWSEFCGNLARAIQPYAHYTTEVEGWVLADLLPWKVSKGGMYGFVAAGLDTYDALKATRITLFHALLTWMLGRILLAQGSGAAVKNLEGKIEELGKALGGSRLLFEKGDWWQQLAPHYAFEPGYDWTDDP